MTMFRMVFLTLTILGLPIWLAWILTGIVSGALDGWHGFFSAILGLFAPLITCSLACSRKLISLRLRPLGPREASCSKEPSDSAIPVNWIYFFLVGWGIVFFCLSFSADTQKWGAIGDSFNSLNTLLLIIGFAFTIRQIRHTESSAASANKSERDNLELQRSTARLQYVQAVMQLEQSNLDLFAATEAKLSNLKAEFQAFDDTQSCSNLAGFSCGDLMRGLHSAVTLLPDRFGSQDLRRDDISVLHEAVLEFRNHHDNDMGGAFPEMKATLLEGLGRTAHEAILRIEELSSMLQIVANQSRRNRDRIASTIEKETFWKESPEVNA